MGDQPWSSRPGTQPSQASAPQAPSYDGQQDQMQYNNFSRPPHAQYRPQQAAQHSSPMSSPQQQQSCDVYGGTGVFNNQPQSRSHARGASQPMAGYAYPEPASANNSRTSMQQPRQQRGVLVKPNRKFTDVYDDHPQGHGGSSGAVRKVQDLSTA